MQIDKINNIAIVHPSVIQSLMQDNFERYLHIPSEGGRYEWHWQTKSVHFHQLRFPPYKHYCAIHIPAADTETHYAVYDFILAKYDFPPTYPLRYILKIHVEKCNPPEFLWFSTLNFITLTEPICQDLVK